MVTEPVPLHKKEQFRADVESIARMKNTIEMGESLLIYPEGEVNGTGRTAPFSDSIAKLAKLLKAPLYAARTHGGLFHPPQMEPRAAARQGGNGDRAHRHGGGSESLSMNELYARIEQKLFVDDYAWQKRRMISFGGKTGPRDWKTYYTFAPNAAAN